MLSSLSIKNTLFASELESMKDNANMNDCDGYVCYDAGLC